MLLAKRILSLTRQPSLTTNLIESLSALNISPTFLHQKQSFTTVPSIAITPRGSDAEEKECKKVFENVNKQLVAGKEGRLFAVVHLCGKQFKITTGDIILVEGYWPPTTGDEIRLEKVLLAGARDFTLIGRPVLEPGLVNVNATVIEKTLTHTKTHFKKKRRKQYMRINFQRSPNTMIRINSIEIGRQLDSTTTNNIDDKRIF